MSLSKVCLFLFYCFLNFFVFIYNPFYFKYLVVAWIGLRICWQICKSYVQSMQFKNKFNLCSFMKFCFNPNPVNLVFYQHALPLWLCLRQGLLCSSRRVTWLRLKSVFNFLVVSSFCGFIVKCIALWWKLMCLLRPWIVWLLTITFTEKNYNLENGYSGKSQLTSNPDYYPKNYNNLCGIRCRLFWTFAS